MFEHTQPTPHNLPIGAQQALVAADLLAAEAKSDSASGGCCDRSPCPILCANQDAFAREPGTEQ